MLKRYGCILLFWLGFGWFAQAQQAWKYQAQVFGTEQGLPSLKVYDSYEDSLGRIWFATDNGLARYDGYTFEVLTQYDGLANNTVYKILADTSGCFWLLNEGPALTYYDGRRFRPFQNNEALSDALYSFNQWNIDAEGGLFIVGNLHQKMLHISFPDQLKEIYPDQLDDLPERRGAFQVGDEFLYMAYPLDSSFVGRPYSLGPGLELPDFIRKIPFAGFRLNSTSTLHLNREGWLDWINTKDSSDHQACCSRISCLANGLRRIGEEYWVTTSEGCLRFQVNEKGLQLLDHFYPKELITSVLRDRCGNYWFTNRNNGIYRISNLGVRTYPISQEQAARRMVAVRIKNGRLFFGDIQGRLYEWRAKQQVELTPAVLPEPLNESFDFLPIIESSFLLGTRAWQYNSDTKQLEDQLSEQVVTALLKRSDGSIIIGTGKGLQIYRDGEVKNHLVVSSENMRVHALHETSDKKVWVGTSSGLYQLTQDSLRIFIQTDLPLNRSILSLTSDASNRLYIGTKDTGIVVVDGDQKQWLCTPTELPSPVVYSMQIDPAGNLWVGSNRGVSRVRWTENRKVTETITYTTHEGLPSDEINAMAWYGGMLWLATSKGIASIDPQLFNRNEVPPILTELSGKTASGTVGPQMNWAQNDISFSFLAIAPALEGQIDYRYRLVGLDSSWISTKERVARYIQLPAGKYQFEVQAANEHGWWSETEALRFQIHPHFTATWWFRLMAFIGIIGVASVSLFLWNRNRRRKTLQLLRISELRQQALSASMNPHFVFNSLNSIQDFVNRNESYEANEYLAKFARLIRLNLEGSTQNTVLLADEIKRLQFYLGLEKLRFEDLKYNLEVDPTLDTTSIYLPSMIIQPFVENAVWHGTGQGEDSNRVQVEFLAQKGTMQVVISDEGPGLKEGNRSRSPEHQSLSIQFTKERLDLLSVTSGKSHSLEIYNKQDRGEGKGTRVILTLPL